MTTGKKRADQAILEQCTGCGEHRELTPYVQDRLCNNCLAMANLLKNNPGTIWNLSRIAGGPASPLGQTKHIEQELPDVLNAVRYRTTDRERNTWYVSVSELDGEPVEIFASTAFDRDQHLQSRISNLTTITRLISLILRHIFLGEKLTLEKTLTQLQRSSRQPDDLPAMLGKILANYHHKKATETDKGHAVP